MYLIAKQFDDSLSFRRKSSLYLNPETPIVFGSEKFPLKWRGTIAGKTVELIQKESILYSIEDIDFIHFPHEYDGMKSQILEWINEVMDDILN